MWIGRIRAFKVRVGRMEGRKAGKIRLGRAKELGELTFYYFLLALMALVVLAPLYWIFTSSFKPRGDMFGEVTLIPRHFTIRNYLNLFTETSYARWFINSLIVAVSFTALGVFFCSLGGFGFAKYEFRFKKVLFMVLLGSIMIPIYTVIIPLFITFVQYGLINTYWSLILPNSANPFGIFLMRQYIRAIPSELIDAARIDGCSEFGIYYKIILPVTKPGLAAVAIFLFLFSWNNLLFPLIFMKSSDMFTLPVGMSSFFSQQHIRYDWVITSCFLTILPVAIVFAFMQRYFIAGLTAGAIKE